MARLVPVMLSAGITAAVVSWPGCSGSGAGTDGSDSTSLAAPHLPDTLRVATLYSPTSFFYYRELPMGYDYDLVSRFASDKGMALHIEVAPSLQSAVAMLDSGLVDLLAYEVPITSQYRQSVVPCGVENITTQVLVQPKKGPEERITDVTQLVGREVYVEANSKYHQRLIHLNEELGGGIIIKPVDRDTLITEDLITMVSEGQIPLTVVDSDIARINKTYYNDLDITLPISFPQRSAWGVSPDHAWLADTISAWAAEESPRKARAGLLKRYYEISKRQPGVYTLNFSSGRMSAYDNIFRKYAAEIGWDWRLLSSMGFTESRYDSTQVSWAGARGVMQLMPATARAFGVGADRIQNNDDNIRAASKVVQSLDGSLKKYVPDALERRKFVVAAYNSGLAHVLDAIAIARKLGYDPQVWDGSVGEAMLLKMNPEYYNDPVVKYGYCHGRQTHEYVKTVFSCYDKAVRQIKT